MKRLMFMMLALGSLAVFVGCSGDESAFGDNELVIDGTTVVLEPGWYNEYPVDLTNGFLLRTDGEVIAEPEVNTHYLREIRFYDQTGETEPDNYVEVLLYSKGGESFAPGSFDVMPYYSADVNGDTPNFAFIESEPYNVELYGYTYFEGVSGKITIKDDGETMTLTFSIDGTAYLPVTITREDGIPSEEIDVKARGQFKGSIGVLER
jgi:hypothetical protein